MDANNLESTESHADNELKALTIEELKNALESDSILLDIRDPEIFTAGFVPGSINIGLKGRFTDWAGSLLSLQSNIILISDNQNINEAVEKLAKVGFNNVVGYVKGGFEAWVNSGEEFDLIIDIEADELAMDLPFDENILVMDVRSITEYAEGHIKDAVNIPLNELTDLVNVANIEETQNVYLHCGSGYRSVIAASLLKRQGLHNLRNIAGGWDSIKEQKSIEIEKESSALN